MTVCFGGQGLSQSVGYNGQQCAGSSISVYITGGGSCGSPVISSQSNWYISPSPSSVTYNYNGTSYGSVNMTFNSATPTVTVRATYSCPGGGSGGTTSNLTLSIAASVTPA